MILDFDKIYTEEYLELFCPNHLDGISIIRQLNSTKMICAICKYALGFTPVESNYKLRWVQIDINKIWIYFHSNATSINRNNMRPIRISKQIIRFPRDSNDIAEDTTATIQKFLL